MNSLALPQPTFPIEVRPATHDDVPFMDRLQKLHGKSVGYFPTGQFNGYVDLGAVLIAHRAGEPSAAVGYVISRDRYLKRDELGVVYQLNVDPSAQRSFVGAALLGAAFERSAYGCKLYCCWCAKDLAANKFWEAMGFVPLAFRAGSDKKKRVHIFWQKRINQGDAVTPWWYPYQTTGGAIRADRLVFPIPAGVHWSDVEATAVPAVGGGDALALPPVRKVKKSQVPKAAVDPHEGEDPHLRGREVQVDQAPDEPRQPRGAVRPAAGGRARRPAGGGGRGAGAARAAEGQA